MKKMFLLLFFFLAYSAMAAEYKEGLHYTTVSDLIEQKNKIFYVYSVYCPYCAIYSEQLLPEISKNFSSNADLEDYYYAPKGQYGLEAIKVLAVMKHVDINKYQAVKTAYFDEIIKNGGNSIKANSADYFIDFGLKAGGISRSEYDTLVDSAEVQDIINSWSSVALPAAAKIGGIPVILVNGRYSLNMESITSMEMFLDIINHLLNK